MWLVGSQCYFEFTLGDGKIDFVIFRNVSDISSDCMNFIVTKEAID